MVEDIRPVELHKDAKQALPNSYAMPLAIIHVMHIRVKLAE
jgi:hypothetical protein